jgi:hypothetical protein
VSPAGKVGDSGELQPQLRRRVITHNDPSRMYPRIDDDDFHRPCRMTENSGTALLNASVANPARSECAAKSPSIPAAVTVIGS